MAGATRNSDAKMQNCNGKTPHSAHLKSSAFGERDPNYKGAG